jgi:hypothetical protein
VGEAIEHRIRGAFERDADVVAQGQQPGSFGQFAVAQQFGSLPERPQDLDATRCRPTHGLPELAGNQRCVTKR